MADLTAEWRTRATKTPARDATTRAREVTDNDKSLLLRADNVPLDVIGELGRSIVEVVGEKRSTWRRWNLIAEASRQTMGWRFATMQDRDAIVAMVADAAELVSLRLTPPELAASPVVFRRPDGSSVFRPKSSTVFTSESQLAAEDRLLERAANLGGPTVPLATVEKITRRPDVGGRMLGDDQADALTRIAVSGRMLDVLVGPAGAGKTTAMNALRRAWEAEHGSGSASGWRRQWSPPRFSPTISGSRRRTRRSGGRTTFSTAPRSRCGPARHHRRSIPRRHPVTGSHHPPRPGRWREGAAGRRLRPTAVRGRRRSVRNDRQRPSRHPRTGRRSPLQKTASLGLRHGHTQAIDTYLVHERITDGDAEAMTDAAYNAWRADRDAGLVSVLIAETHEDVTALNGRARADLILNKALTPDREVELRDGTAAGVGDIIITRQNNRHLRTLAGRYWVRNRDIWSVTAIGDDGTITIARDYGTGTTAATTEPSELGGVGAGSAAPSSCRPRTWPSMSISATHSPPTARKASRPTPRTSWSSQPRRERPPTSR